MIIRFKKRILYCLILSGIYFQAPNLYGQNSDSKEKTIEGLDFEVLPSFVYNTDKGLQYGALANFYYYGKGTKYPNYLYNLYLQTSRTTKKGYVNYIFFDSNHLLPNGMRLIVDISLVNRGFQQFYGFNGYNSLYNKDYIDPRSTQFISRYYYYMHEISRTFDMKFLGKLPIPHLRWELGFGYYNISTLPIRAFRGSRTNKLTLFEKYITEGVIPQNQKNGGRTAFLNFGLAYDTRNDEAIPTKGIWIQGIYLKSPSFLFNRFAYSQVTLTYNQYISLNPKLVFAYRLAYQTKASGEIPFYMLSFLSSTYRMQEALGGSKTIRGVLNQRLTGNGFGLGNFEFRYIPIGIHVLHRNLNIGFNLFEDMGMITDIYKMDNSFNSVAFDYQPGKEKIHHSAGGGIRFIIDHNFIVAFDYGHVFDKRDGTEALYLDLNYLF